MWPPEPTGEKEERRREGIEGCAARESLLLRRGESERGTAGSGGSDEGVVELNDEKKVGEWSRHATAG